MEKNLSPHVAWSGVIILIALCWVSLALGAESKIAVQPKLITISSFFSGINMEIKSDLPSGCQAVITVCGKSIDEEMMRKSRHWDLWMNSGEVDIDNAPLLYIALSSEPTLLHRDNSNFPWGYTFLEKAAIFTGRLKPVEDDTIFHEFIQLKERDKLYHLYPGGLQITSDGLGTSIALANFHLPTRIKPGTYHVTLWILQNGKIMEKRTTAFDVKLAGIPAILKIWRKGMGSPMACWR